MHKRLEELKRLKTLYMCRVFGQAYGIGSHASQGIKPSITHSFSLKECNLCPRIKQSEPIAGISKDCKLAFITQMPLWNNGIMEHNRRTQMLMDIKNHIFDGMDVDFFSLIKCGQTPPQQQEFQTCFLHLENELSRSLASVLICFGGIEALMYFGFKDSMLFGRIVDYKNKHLIITHTLRDLIRNPNLKSETHRHLLIAKGIL